VVNASLPPLSEGHRWLAYAGLLSLLSLLCFGSTPALLLDTHDAETFQDHLKIAQDWKSFFSPHKAQASGRPLAEAVKLATFFLFGNEPAAFHLLVVFFHGLAALLLALLVGRVGGSLWTGYAAGLLFLVNVTHFQAVHHISAVDYPLALCCGLAALLYWIKNEHSPASTKWAFYAFLVLGLMAHLSILMVWPLALYREWRHTGAWRPMVRRGIRDGLLLGGLLLGLVQLASRETSTWHAMQEYAAQSMGTLLWGMGRVLLWFVSRLFTTAHWTPLPMYQQQVWELWLGAGLLGGLLFLVWRGGFLPSWSSLWVLAGLFPYLLLTEATIRGLPAGPSRYLYLASAGSSVLLAWGLVRVGQWRPAAGGLLLVGALLSSYFSLKKVEAISFYTSARSYSAGGEYALAIGQFQRALATSPGAVPLEDLYTRLCLLLVDSEEDFAPLLEEALAAFPESVHLNIYRLAAAAVDSLPQAREQAMKEILTLSGRPHAADLAVRTFHNLGGGLLKKGHPERAVMAFQQALELKPDRVKTLRNLAAAHWQVAASLVGQLQRGESADPAGLERRFMEQIAATIATCQQALELEPDPALFYLLGKAHQQNGQYDEALEAYRLCLLHDAHYHHAHLRSAEVYEQKGQWQEAASSLQAAARLRDGDPEIPLRLGNLYYNHGEPALAAGAYRQAIQLHPGHVQSLANLGTALRALGQFSEAAHAYGRALELEPEDPVLHHNLGGLALEQGDTSAAVEAFARAIELGSQTAETYLVLSRLYHQAGRLDLALKLYEQILASDLQGADRALYARLGEQLSALGQGEMAARALARAQESAPASPGP
jgi:tetratricopeptide (TPR) repeat protein